MWMELLEIPEFPVLRGKKAIQALHDYINELEEQRGKELTEKQTTALIKLTKGLISSIEAETHSDTSCKDTKELRSVTPDARPYMPFSARATLDWHAMTKTRLV